MSPIVKLSARVSNVASMLTCHMMNTMMSWYHSSRKVSVGPIDSILVKCVQNHSTIVAVEGVQMGSCIRLCLLGNIAKELACCLGKEQIEGFCLLELFSRNPKKIFSSTESEFSQSPWVNFCIRGLMNARIYNRGCL